MTRSGSIYVIVFAALAVGRLTAQAHGEECKEFQGSSPEALSTFLQTAAPAFDDPNCIAFALRALGNQRYVPATEVVSKFLDFRRPKTDEEKQGLYLHPQGIDQLYPATYALEMIGRDALPVVLSAIKSSTSSQSARQNAVFVWMAIQRDDSPKAVAALVREAERAPDPFSRQNLEWAAYRALIWCNPPDEVQCKAAVSGLKPGLTSALGNR
jgi:hypothetical protein